MAFHQYTCTLKVDIVATYWLMLQKLHFLLSKRLKKKKESKNKIKEVDMACHTKNKQTNKHKTKN